MIFLEMDSEAKQAWENNSEMIQKLARITELTSADEIPKGSIAISAKGASLPCRLRAL